MRDSQTGTEITGKRIKTTKEVGVSGCGEQMVPAKTSIQEQHA